VSERTIEVSGSFTAAELLEAQDRRDEVKNQKKRATVITETLLGVGVKILDHSQCPQFNRKLLGETSDGRRRDVNAIDAPLKDLEYLNRQWLQETFKKSLTDALDRNQLPNIKGFGLSDDFYEQTPAQALLGIDNTVEGLTGKRFFSGNTPS